MINKTRLGVSSLLLILLATLMYASSGDLRSPSQFTTFTTTSVNYSFFVNNTINSETMFNVAVYNSSNSSLNRPYQELFRANVTNATYFNRSVTMVDGTRVWWYINTTNATVPISSGVQLFDVDTSFLKYLFGEEYLPLP